MLGRAEDIEDQDPLHHVEKDDHKIDAMTDLLKCNRTSTKDSLPGVKERVTNESSSEQPRRQYQGELNNEVAHPRPSHSPAHSNASTYSSQHSHHDDWEEPQVQAVPTVPLHPLPKELERMLRERASASRPKQSHSGQ